MNNLQEIYEKNKKNIIGSETDKLNKLRLDLIKSFDLNNKVLQNNESTKHIDKKIISNIAYNNFDNSLKYEISDNNNSEDSVFSVINGSHYLLKNIKKNDIDFKTIISDNDLIINKFDKYSNTFFNDYILKINSIFLNSGFDFTLKEDKSLNLNLNHEITKGNLTIFAKNYFNIKKNSKLVLIEKFINTNISNSNIVNFFDLEEGSEVLHLVIQNNKKDALLQYSTHTDCKKNASYSQLIFNCSDNSTRNHHYIDLNGSNSDGKLQGIFFAGHDQIVDNKTQINHFFNDCESNQTYKGILTENAKASYLSKTYVDKNAQKTEGYQLSKGILLSDKSYFHSKPELKIYADDVKCSHGSTIGSFDPDQIFYLRTRGFTEKDAKSFLIKSFYNKLMEKIPQKSFVNQIEFIVEEWLSKKV